MLVFGALLLVRMLLRVGPASADGAGGALLW